MGRLVQERKLSRSRSCHLKPRFRKQFSHRFARGKRWQWVSPTLSKPDIGKGLFEAVQFMRTKASGYPSWPGVTDSTQGRIHWRRPTAVLRFSVATLRRTIHSGNAGGLNRSTQHSPEVPPGGISKANSFESVDPKKTLPCLGFIEVQPKGSVSLKSAIGSTD